MTPKQRIADIVKSNDIVLFMKGTALFPQCGFSSRAIAILDRLGAKYETVDVLQDAEIRAGIKEYSDWPTVPQLYVKGEFVGGSDIMMEMFESGELQQLVGRARRLKRPGKEEGAEQLDQRTAAPPLVLAWNQVDANSVAMGVPNEKNGRFLPFLSIHETGRCRRLRKISRHSRMLSRLLALCCADRV